MKILIGHNYYQQFGGEDVVLRQEIDLLRSHGHQVLLVEAFNKDFNDLSWWRKIKNIFSWPWSQEAYRVIYKHCNDFKPDIVHFHNTFFMMTPSVYAACRRLKVPVVQTIHNFRLLCSNALFYRQGKACEECLSHSLWRGVKYACYRNSRVLTWGVVRMLQKNRRRQTWINQVNAFIVPTDFVGKKLVQGGLPKERIWTKPHFISADPGVRKEMGDYFVFSGRLSEEKGVWVLLDAFRKLPHVPLVMMGDGPLRKAIQVYIEKHGLIHVRLTGSLEKNAYFEILRKAKALIAPSVCYETFGLAVAEAFACAVPVIATGHGALKELVEEGNTGFLFKPGDSHDLREKIDALLKQPSKAASMGLNARRTYEERFSAQTNYQQLMAIYEQAKLSAFK